MRDLVLDLDRLRHDGLGRDMTIAIVDVLAERHRQRAGDGFETARDDSYADSELIRAAICHAVNAWHGLQPGDLAQRASWWIGPFWPWNWTWWRPQSPRAGLVRAAALLIAEIERIDRQTERTETDE